MLGTTLNHYEILQELGRGAMGKVYLARDLRLDRKVALKLLPPELVADEMRRKRFDRESRTLAALNHPNVVTLHSVEEADGQPFIVMEWVQGRTLADLLPPRGFPLDRMLALAVPMTAAVAQAHAIGIVHRDIKPSNVMVRDDGVVKVLDFGISKVEPETVVEGPAHPPTDLTEAGRVLGTLPYMSPQQILGHPADARSDVFSLGVILYEMLTGGRPFRGVSDASLVAAILQQPPVSPTRLAPMPREIEQVVLRCLEKEPEGRYPSARELHAALADIQRRVISGSLGVPWPSELPTLAEPAMPTPAATAAPAGTQAAGRRRWRTWGLAAAAGAVLALTGLAGWRWFHPSGAPVTGAAVQPAAEVAIAVLPLRNLSGDAGQDYFSEGTTEALIASLARIGGLRVTSRDSVARYQTTKKSDAEIARELGVAWVVKGSVFRIGQQVQMVVQLVDPQAGTVPWADNFQGELRDIFLFQRQAAESVARETRGGISPLDRSRLAKVQQVEGDVYERYLKARYLINQRTSESLQEALAELKLVLNRNPDYALAWAARAECYQSLGSYGYAVYPPSETIPKAEEAARRALALDETLAEAHTALAVTLMQAWRWAEADLEFRRALELNPSSADAYSKYTRFLIAVGRHQESIDAARQARVLDPLTPITSFLEGTAHYWAGDYDRALRVARSALENQDHWLFRLLAGESAARQGEYAEADAELRRALALDPGNAFLLGAIGKHLARSGRSDEARKILHDLQERSRRDYVAPTVLAKLHFALGEAGAGFALLDKAYEEKDQSLSYLKTDVDYETIRPDPRYAEMLRRIGL